MIFDSCPTTKRSNFASHLFYCCCFYFVFFFFLAQQTKWSEKEEHDSEDGKSRSRLRQGKIFRGVVINLQHIYFNQGCVMGQVMNIHICWFRFSNLLEWGVSSPLLSFLLYFGPYGLLWEKRQLKITLLFSHFFHALLKLISRWLKIQIKIISVTF